MTSKIEQPLPPLNWSALMAIKNDIFANVQHRGSNFELVKASYEANKKHLGLPSSSKRLCRSGCIRQYNLILKNLIVQFESKGGKCEPAPAEIKSTILKPTSRVLVPMADKRKELEDKSWAVLKEMVNVKRSGVPMESNGRVSKVALIDELLK